MYPYHWLADMKEMPPWQFKQWLDRQPAMVQ